MAFSVQEKTGIISEYQQDEKDVGSTEVQVALLTGRIKYLTEHFKQNKKDLHSRHGLQKLVNNRRKLLRYLKQTAGTRYHGLIQSLGLRDSY